MPLASSALSRSMREGGAYGTLIPTTARKISGRSIAQFQATGARRAFPLFDEPGWKVPWTLSLTVPQALMHNLKHNQVLHERNLILTVVFHDVPWIAFDERVEITPLQGSFWRVQVNYGFKNTPDIPQALELCRAQGLAINLFETSYFLSRETVVPTRGSGMAHWREALFAVMSRNAGSVAGYFKLPNNCVIELGTRVQI